MGCACLSTVAPVFPCHAELYSFIQCVPAWGRTRTTQMLTHLHRQVCRQQYGLCYSFAISSKRQSIFKSIHCTCSWNWSYCVQICRALWYKIHPNFNHKITFFYRTLHNLVCTNLSVFQLTFLSLIYLIYCVNHGLAMELYIIVGKSYHFFQAI